MKSAHDTVQRVNLLHSFQPRLSHPITVMIALTLQTQYIENKSRQEYKTIQDNKWKLNKWSHPVQSVYSLRNFPCSATVTNNSFWNSNDRFGATLIYSFCGRRKVTGCKRFRAQTFLSSGWTPRHNAMKWSGFQIMFYYGVPNIWLMTQI